jgi:hypothetical protein
VNIDTEDLVHLEYFFIHFIRLSFIEVPELFLVSLQELCNKVVSSELNREQEALLGVLMPVLMSEPHTASMTVDSVVMLFRKANELSLSPGSSEEVRFYFR